MKKAIQLLGSISPRLLIKKKLKIRRIFVTLSAISVNRKIIILFNVPKSKKTSSNFGNFHFDNREKRRKIRMGILHLISHDF